MDMLFWLLLGVILWIFVARAMPAKGVQTIDTNALRNKLKQKDIQFIDVRTRGEYEGNHIKQFQNIPLQTLKQSFHSLDPSKEIIVICQSGVRSMQAAKILKKNGFEQITNVIGGMNQWK
ncbi:rhodanese-like domain-containing protein [Pseudogracilibacillus sp. SO10305]|uniref:rhodanese-like domain-containing protein n=1 Tax=Pseudogracilibacillus sp. SO10305 TaxID=3098292 RepID=UPI00300DC926